VEHDHDHVIFFFSLEVNPQPERPVFFRPNSFGLSAQRPNRWTLVFVRLVHLGLLTKWADTYSLSISGEEVGGMRRWRRILLDNRTDTVHYFSGYNLYLKLSYSDV
jgi:hypothetical protein